MNFIPRIQGSKKSFFTVPPFFETGWVKSFKFLTGKSAASTNKYINQGLLTYSSGEASGYF